MKNILFIFLASILVISCTKDFDTINTNNDQASKVVGSLVLKSAIAEYADLSIVQNQDFGDIMGQYTANYEGNNIDVYKWGSDSRYWSIYSILQNINDVETYGKEISDANYQAVAKVLRAYGMSILTDVYGDVPYSDAGKAKEGNFAPAYDSQSAIYAGLIQDLAAANDMIDGSGSVAGDILFGGDMKKWKAFANSLRLRLLMRSSKAQDNKQAISEMVANPDKYPLILDNTNDAIYHFSGSFPDISPEAAGRGREYDYYLGAASANIINALKANDDPRMMEWFDPSKTGEEYKGLPVGLSLGEISEFGGRDGSARKAAAFFSNTTKQKAIFLTSSEVNFILAEAAQSGIISGDAKSYYDNGVQASFGQWGVAMPEGFLDKVVFNADNLAVQKWISLYQNSLQGWLDWKRTGLPTFIKAGPGTTNNGKVPVRLMYPAIEQSVNATNYKAAASAIGGDNINARIWWDK